MAKSTARKKREKLEKAGFRNPDLNRGVFVFSDMRTRTTKTKKGTLSQSKHKKRLSDHYESGNDSRSFLFLAVLKFNLVLSQSLDNIHFVVSLYKVR